ISESTAATSSRRAKGRSNSAIDAAPIASMRWPASQAQPLPPHRRSPPEYALLPPTHPVSLKLPVREDTYPPEFCQATAPCSSVRNLAVAVEQGVHDFDGAGTSSSGVGGST